MSELGETLVQMGSYAAGGALICVVLMFGGQIALRLAERMGINKVIVTGALVGSLYPLFHHMAFGVALIAFAVMSADSRKHQECFLCGRKDKEETTGKNEAE